MYESIFDSELFSLFFNKYRRGNAPSIKTKEQTDYFWIVISICDDFVNHLNSLVEGEVNPLYKLSSESKVKKFNKESFIDDNDISWLSQNPHQLIPSQNGEVVLNGFSYSQL